MENTKTQNKPWQFQPGQLAWNKGKGGCRRGHEPSLYRQMPSGVFVCLGCKRENAAVYRNKNRQRIRLLTRVRRYGIDLKELDMLWTKQDGKCAICGTNLEGQNYCIDHGHTDGKVRGILCVSCNTGIGCLKDSPIVLIRAVRYLSRNGNKD